jgi:large subunit ribosomal protein L17
MKHRIGKRKLNRNSSHRKALLRNMATNLIEKGFMVTTLEKAKELRGFVEPLVTLAKEDDFNRRRKASSILFTSIATQRLFKDIGPAHKNRAGGYLRLLKLGFRPGDNARRAFLEFVDMPVSHQKENTSTNS